jgi:hypothetical protein
MKKILLVMLLALPLLAFEGAAVKVLSKFFGKESIELVSKRYGTTGVRALEKLSADHGKDALGLLQKYSSKYGDEGIKLLARYGEKAVANRASFEMVKKFSDKGFYLVKQFPQKSVKYYDKYGDTFVKVAEKIGSTRTIRYLDGAAKYGKEDKVLKFLDKYGEKGNAFLDRHWGKMLTTGFVLLNADSLIESTKNIANHGLDKGGEVAQESIKNIANSQLGWMIGLALLLFVFFKYGIEAMVTAWKRRKA